MGWEGHVTRKEGGRNAYKFWTENLRGDHLKVLRVRR